MRIRIVRDFWGYRFLRDVWKLSYESFYGFLGLVFQKSSFYNGLNGKLLINFYILL